jgi:hypothetical protein
MSVEKLVSWVYRQIYPIAVITMRMPVFEIYSKGFIVQESLHSQSALSTMDYGQVFRVVT